jgi:AcrR family transcriptional regulator
MTALARGNVAKERILLAAIASLERWGIEGVTTRVIAKEARANVAAVNYHFGNKEALLRVALEKVRDQGIRDPLFEIDAQIARISDTRSLAARKGSKATKGAAPKGGKGARTTKDSPASAARADALYVADLRRVVEHVLVRVVENGIRFPRSAFAHLRTAIVEHEYDGDAVASTNDVVLGLEGRLRPAMTGTAKERVVAVAHAWSAIVLACLAPGLLASSTGLDLKEPKDRRVFVKVLLDRLFTAANEDGRARRKKR